MAQELGRIALMDDYFISRKLDPNVDFCSGMICQAMRFPVEMFPVLSAIPMTSGLLAQCEEMLADSDRRSPRRSDTGARIPSFGNEGNLVSHAPRGVAGEEHHAKVTASF
jgi:citrate synthase